MAHPEATEKSKINNVDKAVQSRAGQNSLVQRDNCKSNEITVFTSYVQKPDLGNV